MHFRSKSLGQANAIDTMVSAQRPFPIAALTCVGFPPVQCQPTIHQMITTIRSSGRRGIYERVTPFEAGITHQNMYAAGDNSHSWWHLPALVTVII